MLKNSILKMFTPLLSKPYSMKKTCGFVRLLAIPVTLLGAALTTSGYAQTPGASAPVGSITLSIKGNGGTKASEFTYLGLSMAPPVDFQAVAEKVAGTVLTCSAATWTSNQFAKTPLPGYFLEVRSGTLTGLMTQIVSCDAATKTLTLAENLTFLGVETTNVSFEIRKNWSIGTIFGATNTAGLGAGSATTADQIRIYNPELNSGNGGYDTYFYSNDASIGAGWRKVRAGAVNQVNTPIILDEGIIVQRFQSADLSFPLVGAVKRGETLTTIFFGSNFVGNVYPSGLLTLGLTDPAAIPPKYSSNLYTGNPATGVLGGTFTTGDLISIYNPALSGGAGGYDSYFYSTGGTLGIGWRKNGAGTVNQAGTVLAFGKSIRLTRRATGNFHWVIPQPFPNL